MKDVIIIGAGIVGLATAYQIIQGNPGCKIQIIDKEKEVAFHQSGRNSGVIHSGIYYQPGSLRATNCKRGYQMLLDFCQEHSIKHEICGKVIVATNKSELPVLESIYQKGLKNGLDQLAFLDAEQLKEKEPHVNGVKAIFVPQSGIIDFRSVANKLRSILESKGVVFTLGQKVVEISKTKYSVSIQTKQDDYSAKYLIACTGLYSDKIAKLSGDDPECKILPFRGEYYKLKRSKEYLVNNLIYPVPDPNFPFLGVHFTRMIKGGIDAGPNAVFAFKREGYKFSDFNLSEFTESVTYKGFIKMASRNFKTGIGEMKRSLSKRAFVKNLQKLIPVIKGDDLEKSSAGVRATAIDVRGNIVDDFKIHPKGRIIHVINAPSPAATASLSIGKHIADIYISLSNN